MKQQLLRTSLLVVLILLITSCTEQKKSTVYTADFENFETAVFTQLESTKATWSAAENEVEIGERQESDSGKFLHILEGQNKSVSLTLKQPELIKSLAFKARTVKQDGFSFKVEGMENGKWIPLYNGDKELVTKNRVHTIALDINKNIETFKFTSNTTKMGVFIDDFHIYRSAKMSIETVEARQPLLPTFKRKAINKVVKVSILIDGNLDPKTVESLHFDLIGTNLSDIEKMDIYATNSSNAIDAKNLFGTATEIVQQVTIEGSKELQTGMNHFWLSINLKESAALDRKIAAVCKSIQLKDGSKIIPTQLENSRPQRIGVAVRNKGEDKVHTYRIPGLATTNKGTLIGVYDNRYSQGADLQGDIDVAMSRSTDGGSTWEAMKPIIDMGEFGGLPQDENGIGDPAVLVDRSNNTIWVAGIWAHGHPGKRNWWASKQGMKPAETSQFILSKSEDDGLTWSAPINITEQIKAKGWYLLLQGPGKGITLKDGTLVFPAQFKDEKQMPYSTIIYSKDHGKTWGIGTGAKSNTTEAQVVELSDGTLMLNMRDNRRGSRSVYTTKDLGTTWTTHETSRKALIEPVCMASLISFDHPTKGKILFFSNPNSTKGRTNITIKTSFDEGKTWPVENQLELYEDGSYGYSCLTVVDENNIGILYEGAADMYYEKININELLGDENIK